MTIPRLKAITEYQQENPPIHVMIAAYLGAGKAQASETNEDGQSLFELFPQS